MKQLIIRLRKRLRKLTHNTRFHLPYVRFEDAVFRYYLDYHTKIRKHMPILIFQMGKVGSSSVSRSFPIPNYPIAEQIHHLSADSIEKGMAHFRKKNIPIARHLFTSQTLYERVVTQAHPYKVITLVREPISRNMSSFFENFKIFTDESHTNSQQSVDDMIITFVKEFDHWEVIDWFDHIFLPSIGIDVYNYPFDPEQGWSRIQSGNVDILILRTELDNHIKEQAIAQFLDVPHFTLQQANVPQAKAYADDYQQFKKHLVLPEPIINSLLSAKYTQHFYSEQEIEVVRQKWLKRLHQ